MEVVSRNERLLRLTRDLLDIKKEKKDQNKVYNERIKDLEQQIASVAAE